MLVVCTVCVRGKQNRTRIIVYRIVTIIHSNYVYIYIHSSELGIKTEIKPYSRKILLGKAVHNYRQIYKQTIIILARLLEIRNIEWSSLTLNKCGEKSSVTSVVGSFETPRVKNAVVLVPIKISS